MLLDEVKVMRTDIFDIKNRVKIIMDKVSIQDKNNVKTINFKKNFESNDKIDLQISENNKEKDYVNLKQNNNININNEINYNINESKDKKNKNKDKDKDKKIKIIMVNENNNIKLVNNNLVDDNTSEFNNDELDNEFKKILC